MSLGICGELQLPRTRADNFASALIVCEPEDVVLPERAAHRIAELVAAQFCLEGIEIIAGVEFVVADELEPIPVNAVGAGLGDRVHHRTAEFSVFGIKAVGDQPEFFDGVEVGDQPGAQVASLADIAAIHQEGI